MSDHSRRRAREAAFQFLYQNDCTNVENADLEKQLKSYFTHFQVGEPIQEFCKTLIVGAIQHRQELDAEIESLSKNWKVKRMAIVDRNLVRMGLYELLHVEEVPSSVTLNEIVELAKMFGTKESASFINGILDAALKNHTQS